MCTAGCTKVNGLGALALRRLKLTSDDRSDPAQRIHPSTYYTPKVRGIIAQGVGTGAVIKRRLWMLNVG